MPDSPSAAGSPIDGHDYYMDGPWLVFTREYHLRRGYCCQSGCRHCPWNYRKDSADNNIRPETDPSVPPVQPE